MFRLMSNKISKQIGHRLKLVTRKFRNNAGLAWRVYLKSESFQHNSLPACFLSSLVRLSLLPLVGAGERRARCARGVPSQSKWLRISGAINSKTLSASKIVYGNLTEFINSKRTLCPPNEPLLQICTLQFCSFFSS